VTRSIPNVVECANCGRRMDPRVYQASPGEETPEECITRVVDPGSPYVAVQCARCAHYTIVAPFKAATGRNGD
jgi:ribosomal protein S27E